MARYPLNLPLALKEEAERYATEQGISLNQFILWAVSEKVGSLRQELDDPAYPRITYRRGGAGIPEPVLRGTALHVRALAIANRRWEMSAEEIASEYQVDLPAVREALAFYDTHREEIDAAIAANEALDPGLASP